MAKKEYTGSVYIGVVGPSRDIPECWASIQGIARRPGDAAPLRITSTKGFEARQAHLNNWINNTAHDFALFLDHDMVYQDDTLERLLSHKLPYVSGMYMRRSITPMIPIWFKPWTGSFPVVPMGEIPERGRLHKIGASGWGCILLHREVVLETRKVLKGEPEIIEDDMDVWPYDLERVFGALKGLRELVDGSPPAATLRAALGVHVEALTDELRPLQGKRDNVGSDIRFPFYARAAGFQLWGDPDVRCQHMIDYPLSMADYEMQANADVYHVNLKAFERDGYTERRRVRRALERLS